MLPHPPPILTPVRCLQSTLPLVAPPAPSYIISSSHTCFLPFDKNHTNILPYIHTYIQQQPPSDPAPCSPPPLTLEKNSSVSGAYRIMASFCPRDPAPNTHVSNWIECYNPTDHTWTHLDSVPGLPDNHVLKGFAMVAVADAVFIIGGRLCRKKDGAAAAEADEDVEVLPTVLRYDVGEATWTRCAPMGTPRADFACTVCGDRIYVAGGKSTLASARGVSSAEVYDPALDAWTPLPDMSTRRYKCVGVTWQGRILVVGGFADRSDSDRTVPYGLERSSAEVLDPDAGEWELAAGMWQLDVPPNQILAVGRKLFSSGDCLMAWKGHIEAYDMEQNIWNIVDGWSQLESLCSPVYLTVVPVGSLLYFLAGSRSGGRGDHDSNKFVSMVHVFDTLAANGDAWSSMEPIEQVVEKELCSHACVFQLS